ncbi:MAG TPA: hypothetical protein VH210_11675 [Gaiellaceae bacterium]|jgi:hypothetical protein|nr:hypothetical protein [Gaiellaceae bacterium]
MMNDSTRVVRSTEWAWPPAARTAAATIATAGLAVLAAGCGGSSGSHATQRGTTVATSSSNPSAASAQKNGALAFSRCMRSHGVPTFPDPTSGGAIPKVALQQLGISDSQFQAARRACQHLLPNGGQPANEAERQQIKAQAFNFSQCVRSHGVPHFPDPDSTGRIPDPATVGVDQGSPKFQSANQACRKYRPPYLPSNGAYNSYARTHG